ncbi:hypothetical protein HYV86_05830 [Candidatus Woesearchaeota archaeon]|nr:hypothetical protein [Candidatus Woesearchaeota archaeon]
MDHTRQTLCAIALTALPALAAAEQGTIELTGNDQLQTVDVLVAGPAPFTAYSVRTRATIEDEKAAVVVVPRLFYNVAGCLDIQIDAQLNKEVRYGVGLKCVLKVDDLKLLFLAEANETSHWEQPHGFFQAVATYTPTIAGIPTFLSVENITNIGEEGHLGSIQRLRLGPRFDGTYTVGAGLDLAEPMKGPNEYTPLVVLRKDF